MRPVDARLLTRLKPWLPHWGTALSSVLIVAAFPPWDFRALAWFCLIPWLLTLSRCTSARQAFRQGVWMSFGMSVLGFHWVAYVLHQFAMLPWIVSALGLALYSLAGQPQFLLFAPIYFHLRRTLPRSMAGIALWTLLVALLYTGIDHLLPKLFCDTLGHSQYSAPWLRQSADLGGADLLTFVLFWMNLVIAVALEKLLARGEKSPALALRPALPSLALTLILALVLTFYGKGREAEIGRLLEHPVSTAHAGIIQANIGDFEKVAAESGLRDAGEKVLHTYMELSDQALSLNPKPDFLMWPETAYPSTFRKPFTIGDYSRDQRIESFVRNRRTPLLFGSYDRDLGKDFNSFFVLAPGDFPPELASPIHSQGKDLEFYHKNILLLFGEYVPFQDNLPFFNALFPQVANFGRGIGPDVLNIPIYHPSPSGAPGADGAARPAAATVPVATEVTPPKPVRMIKASPLICYEVLFPDYVIAAANQGSQMILNVTNDSWFGPYGEPHLHLALSIFRTIETRLPLVRATNTGFSALVNQNGEITERSQLFQPQILNVEVPMIEPVPTLIKRWGDWFGRFALVTGSLGLLALWGVDRKRGGGQGRLN